MTASAGGRSVGREQSGMMWREQERVVDEQKDTMSSIVGTLDVTMLL